MMMWHMAFNSNPKNFNVFFMILLFAFGGGIGYYMQSIELALFMSILFSLFFI